MANTVNQLNYANTFADWMVVTNAIGVETNVLGKGDYKKDTGTLYLNETTQNSLQSNGTAVFQKEIRSQGVGSSVTIQNDLTVTSGQVYFSNTTLGLTNAGQANINGLLVAQGPNTSLYVANNSVTGGNTIVRYNTTTNNLKANVNIDTVRLSSSENITTAHLQANTDVLTGTVYANNWVITPHTNGGFGVFGQLQANTSVLTDTVNANTEVNTTTINVDTVNSVSLNTSSLSVSGTSNVKTLKANTSIETPALIVTGTRLDALSADAKFNSASITGNFTVNGTVVYNTPTLTISAESPNQDSYLGTYRTGVGSPTANAYLRWNESQGYWDATANSTTGTYYRLLTNEHLSGAADSSSTTTVATSAAVNTANTYLRTYTNTANTAMKSYVDSANTAMKTYVDSANTAMKTYVDTTVSTANTSMKSYVDSANTAMKTYVDSANTAMKSYVDTANNYVVNYVNTQVTANVLNSGAAVVVAQNYSSTTTDSDPGNGTFRFNAAVGSATFAYMDNLDAYGATITSILSTYGDSTNTVKGHLRFSVYGASTTKYAVFAITSSTAATGYYKIGLSYVAGAGTFTTGDLVMIQYSRAGNVGAQGAQGYQGVQGAQGYQGVQGAQGYQGVQGAQGYQGVQGPQGYQGVQGAQGFQGVAGGFTTNSDATVNSLRATNSIGVGSKSASGTAGQVDISGNLNADGDITAGLSDQRLKIVEGVIQDPLNKITSIDGVYYTYNEIARGYGYQSAARQVGLLAQQVNKILPEVTPLAPFDTDENGASKSGENYMTIQYEKLVPLLVESIKQLNREVETLKKDVETLKNNK